MRAVARSALGHPRVHRRLTGSTNELARALALRGAPHGTLVTADEQSAGRGRQGRTWSAPPGRAVLMSLVLRELHERHAVLPLSAAVAVCEACEAAVPVTCEIKWPNDVWIAGRKVAGILVEGRPQDGWAVVGIGLNVSTEQDDLPEELSRTATSLQIAAGGIAPTPSPETLLELVLEALNSRLAEAPAQTLSSWRERDALLGRRVRWPGGEGSAAGIDEGGALLVETAEGGVALDAGEVHLLS